MKKRKICFILTSPIHYSRNFLILEALKKRKDVELHIVLGGSILLNKYVSHSFNIKKILFDEKYKNVHEAHFNLDGDDVVVKSKTTGLGVVEFSSVFNEIKPDLVVVRADRFEVMAAALAASYMNTPIAHIEGGDKSGTLDESVRHAITKLSHIHFATNKEAYDRIIRMGEKTKYVFNFGSPDIEVVKNILKNGRHVDLSNEGSGSHFNPQNKFLMVMYHPVASEIKNLSLYTKEILKAIKNIDMQTLWFWPNFDAGSETIAKELRIFNDSVANHKIKFLKYLHPKKFLTLLSKTECLIGNSSAGIKECSYVGVPVVNVGSRQNERLKSENVLDCGHSSDEIRKVIRKQMKRGRFKASNLYSSNDTSREIAEALATSNLYTQKSFVD